MGKYYTMKYDKESVRELENPKFIYFWGHRKNPDKVTKTCFSQWYFAPFEHMGETYATCEHWMMTNKALLFDDNDMYDKMFESDNPQTVKKLGRKVKNFDSETWDNAKYQIVVQGNFHKFSLNEDLKEFLLSTGDAILVEASPYDKIWGIGLGRPNKKDYTVDEWRGENLLGFALMEVRDMLRES